MENASKALILAASVLIAILIIAMGVTIFNKAHNSADTSNLDQAEINMFNQKFERYNNSQLGSQVKSLISFAISNANTNKEDPIKLPTITLVGQNDTNGNSLPSATGDEIASNNINEYINKLGDIRKVITSTHSYTIELDYAGTGLIYTITITY